MGLFAHAFSPDNISQAASILNEDGQPQMMHPHHGMDQATGLAGHDPNLIKSLFDMIRGHGQGQLPVNIGGQQPMARMPVNMMNYFGG